jgi:hypothetical protein
VKDGVAKVNGLFGVRQGEMVFLGFSKILSGFIFRT